MSAAYRIRVKFNDGRERYLSKGKVIWDVREERGLLMTRLEVVNAALLYVTSSELSEVTIVRTNEDTDDDAPAMEVYESNPVALVSG